MKRLVQETLPSASAQVWMSSFCPVNIGPPSFNFGSSLCSAAANCRYNSA